MYKALQYNHDENNLYITYIYPIPIVKCNYALITLYYKKRHRQNTAQPNLQALLKNLAQRQGSISTLLYI